MKLIIDISEGDYKFIKDLQSLIIGGRGSCKTIQINVINAIRNGTPYEPKSDLISLEALKEQFNHLEMVTNSSSLIEQAEYKMLMTCISLIDNAPTVEIATTLQPTCNNLQQRPQGEWAEIEGGYICSNCEDIESYTPNFCPNCGADMRKGGAE